MKVRAASSFAKEDSIAFISTAKPGNPLPCRAIEKFRRRFTDMEADLIAQGTSIGKAGQDDMERSWQAAKAHERTRSGDPT